MNLKRLSALAVSEEWLSGYAALYEKVNTRTEMNNA